ncbi:MAG: hypothetical protein DRN14_05720 [Thermoplasmata archaeon]|nr:MAG: hypothetical protein DRN14_05720 [Thermoplasmata archaeon]
MARHKENCRFALRLHRFAGALLAVEILPLARLVIVPPYEAAECRKWVHFNPIGSPKVAYDGRQGRDMVNRPLARSQTAIR